MTQPFVGQTTRGAVLPGGHRLEWVERAVPQPGRGQVLLRMRASICGSDVRAIYREHLGHGAEAYQGVIAGHEPAGQVVAVGPGCRRMGMETVSRSTTSRAAGRVTGVALAT